MQRGKASPLCCSGLTAATRSFGLALPVTLPADCRERIRAVRAPEERSDARTVARLFLARGTNVNSLLAELGQRYSANHRLRQNAHTSPARLVIKVASAVLNDLLSVIMGHTFRGPFSPFIPVQAAPGIYG